VAAREKKSRKRWVNDLLAKRDALERAVGVPVGELLGCGHFGCVFTSEPPWVVKLSVDPTEGPIWAEILNAIEENAGYGADGFCRVKDIVRLKPDVGMGKKKRALYAVVREAVMPVFTDEGYGGIGTTEFTLEQLGLAGTESSTGYRDEWWERLHEEHLKTPRVRDFAATIDALMEYRKVGVMAQYIEKARNPRVPWWHREQYLESLRDRGYASGYPPRLVPDWQDRLQRRAEQAAYKMGGPIGGPLGESLVMLAGMGIVLRDVHLMNVGWRIHDCIGDDCADTGAIVIFDPGHTPSKERREIPERMVVNGRWPG
jgi:hypothetical protein